MDAWINCVLTKTEDRALNAGYTHTANKLHNEKREIKKKFATISMEPFNSNTST